jgi:2-polyprenyl-6-methoxyphenol hydroxylase-like FAD-dependent oxidoreductase
MTVIIAGAGIGGLTAALSLNQAGVDVVVCESVARLEPLGVGINVLPHAARELYELGLECAFVQGCVKTEELVFLNKHGQMIWSEPRGLAAGYCWPQISIHRGRLQAILLETARQRLGEERILCGCAVAGWDEDSRGVQVRLEGRDGSVRTIAGSLLIGADGIHSRIRREFYPDEGPPCWNGAILWRGVSQIPVFAPGPRMFMAGHEWQKFVCYPIDLTPGRAVVNWIAELKFSPDYEWRREDWNRQGQFESFLPRYEGWSFGWLDVPGIIRAAERCFEFPMVDREPLPRWSQGRVTLLGDAAHPMYPIGSNGASQAILDGRVLAREIRSKGETAEALAAYEAERRPPTAKIVAANRANQAEKFMQLVEDRAPGGFRAIEDVMPRAEIEVMMAEYKRLAGFDRDTLNARPPLLS